MHLQFKQFLQRLPDTPESPCSYFSGKNSRSKAFVSDENLPEGFFEYILNRGYRRCGNFYYAQSCHHCSLCMSYRLPLKKFAISKSQKRVLKKNTDVKLTIKPPQVTIEKEELYLRYQWFQHHNKPMPGFDIEEFDRDKKLAVMYEQMYHGSENSIELELHLDQELIAFGVIDIDADSASAVYSVYQPDLYDRSLGTFFILQSIEWAIQNQYKHLHLGYFIPGHKKMNYKEKFKPAEIYDSSSRQWHDAEQFLNQMKRTEVTAK